VAVSWPPSTAWLGEPLTVLRPPLSAFSWFCNHRPAWDIVVITLIVGGIGIMNIMLTSVIERTREIGVRRTVGATRRDVTLQFLVETLLMTLGGGVMGIASGVIVSWGITAFAGWSTHISTLSVLMAFFVSFAVGLVFGIYPAIKAGSLQPVDAMRYE
jgi:ABC-type antimicrobial peptide transport system permease subunit